MTTIQIRHRYTDAVLFECEVPAGLESGLHMRHALEQASATRANLAWANLAWANLAWANLDGANLAWANLAEANLDGANLAGANLAWANLARANLARANLDGASLAWANLARANLAGANLARANLARANLAGANLAGATFGHGVTASRGVLQVLGLRWVVTVFDAHMLIGCQMHSLDDWAAFDDRQIAAMDGAHALRFWRQHKTKLLALGQREDVSA
jgi:uncharacterized protein YjbI with pentapeptide repeats